MLTSNGESKNSGNSVMIEMCTTGEYRARPADPLLYRHRVTRRLLFIALICSALLLGSTPAHAQVTGACDLVFNGIDVDRIDSLSSPLELDTGDTLTLEGTDPTATRSARVEIIIGPMTIDSNTTTYATPEWEFLATISLEDVSPLGVGLFRVEGTTDNCTAAAWMRLSGRFPLATLVGLIATALTLGGITGQLGAIASRRRWARSATALGGIATGTGLAFVGQGFGRLQVSYPSLAGLIAAAGGLGFVLASIFNPSTGRKRRRRRSSRPAAYPAPRPVSTPKTQPVTPHPTLRSVKPPMTQGAEPDPVPLKPPLAAEPLTEPRPSNAPYWCYVIAPTDVFDLSDHSKTIAVLAPGNWYLAKQTLAGWVQVVATEGSEGWVAEEAIRRQS